MRRLYGFAALAPAVMVCLTSLSAWADPVSFSLDGGITFASDVEPFGVDVGDPVLVTGTFNNLLMGSGLESVSFGSGSGNTLQIFVGSLIFNETDDDRYLGGLFPTLDFSDGSLVLFNYVSSDGPGINGPGFESDDSRAGNTFFSVDFIDGRWNYDLSFKIIPIDDDGDGVLNDDDICPDTMIPEGVPTVRLNPNRWALTDDDDPLEFDTLVKGKGKGPNRSYTIEDTLGCSCEQIVEMQGLGDGHTKFGCSISAMDDWVELVNP